MELYDNSVFEFEKSPIKNNISVSDLQHSSSDINILNIKDKFSKKIIENNNDLVISIQSKESFTENKAVIITTHNYVGEFFYQGVNIKIGSRFGWPFLSRMLNFVDDVFIGDINLSPLKNNSESQLGKLILCYLFIQSLEKAYLLGFPKCYRSIFNNSSAKFRGRLDINNYVKKAIPFYGNLPSITREQEEIQVIASVILRAVKTIENNLYQKKSYLNENSDPFLKIRHILRHLSEVNKGKQWNSSFIQEAKSHKALFNPIFSPYIQVLNYAELIIKIMSFEKQESSTLKPYCGILINIAELFEIYVRKLLQKNLPEWQVHSPKIKLHQNQFYQRSIIPDIVIENKNYVAVFDTKYKRMRFETRSKINPMGDLDREDFFQINTYMSYFSDSKSPLLVCGGLLYPLTNNIEIDKCHGEWIGNQSIKFIVDGINIKDCENSNFYKNEIEFIGRIKNYLYKI